MKLDTESDVTELHRAANALAVVSAWSELGLFERLRKGPVARRELPADARALAVTIPILLHLGLLVTDGERVGLTTKAENLLASGAMPTGRNLQTFGDLSRTAAVLRDGGPVRDESGRGKATRGGTTPEDAAATERFLDMLYRLSEQAARETYEWLAPGLSPKSAVLDLGGGHGRYARAFADGGHDVTVFDQPLVVELTRKRHGDALRTLAGDFHTAERFGGPYDLVLLCNIVHGESDAANASMIARAAASLRPGGRIAIRDMFIDEHGQNPASAVFFGMTMLFYTEAGTSPTVSQARAWFAAAGLVDVRIATFESHLIVTATKRT